MARRNGGLRFQVIINGRRVCVSGMEGYGVLSAILSRVKRSPKAYPGKHKHPLKMSQSEWSKERIEFEVGGLDSSADRHVHWLRRKLNIGDEIVIKILPAGKYDAPKDRHRRLTARSRGTRASRRER